MVCSRCGASDHVSRATACAEHEQITQTPTATDSSRAPADNAQASNNRSAPSNAEAGNQCMTLVAVGDARMSDHDAGLDRDEPSSSAKLGRRIVKPRKLFDPEPSVLAHITAALLLNPRLLRSYRRMSRLERLQRRHDRFHSSCRGGLHARAHCWP